MFSNSLIWTRMRVINAFIEKLVMSELGFERQRPLRRDDLAMIRAIC
jgi:hypothetical protein